MEHLDRLILLAILGAIGVFVLFLLRRAREKEATPRPVGPPAEAIPVVQPVAVAVPFKRKKLKRKRAPTAAPAAKTRTPIHTVLGMLQDNDRLTAAFLLREILAPPVSKRK